MKYSKIKVCILFFKVFFTRVQYSVDIGLPWWLSGKEPSYQCKKHKRHSLIPGLGRSFGRGHGNPLQYSCLENPMDRGAWRATVHGVTSQARLSDYTTNVVKSHSKSAHPSKNTRWCPKFSFGILNCLRKWMSSFNKY